MVLETGLDAARRSECAGKDQARSSPPQGSIEVGINMSKKAFNTSYDFVEKNEADQTALGVIYRSGVVDSQGDYALADDLEKAVEYLASNPSWPKVVDVRHNRQPTDSKLIESYVARSDGPFYKTGDWIGKVKLSDREWPLVASGELRAFSLYGRAGRERTNYKNQVATRMRFMEVEFISLVPRGANQVEFISKEEMPAWAKKWSESMDTRVKALTEKIGAIAKARDTQVGKEKHRVRRVSDIRKPKNKRGNKNNRASVTLPDKEARRAEQLRRHRKYLSALAAIKHDGFGNYSDAQRRAMDSLVDDSGLSPDHVWEGLFDVGAKR